VKTTQVSLLLIALTLSLARAADLVPLPLELPKPAFTGTPKDMQLSDFTDPFPDPKKPRPAFLAPAGVTNVARGAKVTSSDTKASADTLAKLVDGEKEGENDHIALLRKGTQWTQVELPDEKEIYAIVIWNGHNEKKVYHDFIVQLSSDAAFSSAVITVYNNDRDGSSGQGIGTDREFFESWEGRLIPVGGKKAKYVRYYTKGSTEGALNERTEIEIYAKP